MKTTTIAVLFTLCYGGAIAESAIANSSTMSESIQTVKQRHTDKLMAIKGVMAVGIGLAADGSQAIVVTVEKGNEQAARQLPSSLEGYPLIIQFSGKIRAQ